MMILVELTEDDIGTLQAAVENLRSCDKTESRTEAAWRIAHRLAALATRAEEARRDGSAGGRLA